MLLASATIAPGLDAQQAERSESLAGEKAAERLRRSEMPENYNIDAGPVALSVSGSLRMEYDDNITRAQNDRLDDFILRPEARLQGIWPLTPLNAIDFSIGVGYVCYTSNTELNSDVPLISPGTQLALLLFVGDFRIRLTERFSYLESLAVQSADYINLDNTAIFKRLQNNAGLSVDWDLAKLVLSLKYEHEDFVSYTDRYDYLTRASELLNLSGDFFLGPKFKVGLETRGSRTDYDEDRLSDHWRFAAGPFVDATISPYFSFRAGAGYDGVYLDTNPAGNTDLSDYYAYAQVRHRLNQHVGYGLTVAHENRLGWNAANMNRTYASLGLNWYFLKDIDLYSYVAGGPAKEEGGVYEEDYTYLQAGLWARWQCARRWGTSLSYDYLKKDSDRALRDYYQNRIGLGIDFRF